jgi:hypothetical protein
MTMRFDKVTLPPKQRWARLVDLYLFVNLMLALLTAFLIFIAWVSRAMWYQRTGGLVPFPQHNPLKSVPPGRRWIVGLGLACAWVVWVALMVGLLSLWIMLCRFVARWLTQRWFPIQDMNPFIYNSVLLGPFLLLVLITTVGSRAGREAVVSHFRREWTRASRAERAARLASGLLPLVFLAFVASGAPAALFGSRPNAVSISLLFLLLFGVTGVLAVVQVLATRRRS